MKAENHKSDRYKLMGATFEVHNEHGFGVAGQPQPGGLPEISRGLSASDTPGTPSNRNRTPEGCHNSSACLPRGQLLESLAPFQGAFPLRWLSGGVASLRSAQPPANVCEPFGFVAPCHIQLVKGDFMIKRLI